MYAKSHLEVFFPCILMSLFGDLELSMIWMALSKRYIPDV